MISVYMHLLWKAQESETPPSKPLQEALQTAQKSFAKQCALLLFRFEKWLQLMYDNTEWMEEEPVLKRGRWWSRLDISEIR